MVCCHKGKCLALFERATHKDTQLVFFPAHQQSTLLFSAMADPSPTNRRDPIKSSGALLISSQLQITHTQHQPPNLNFLISLFSFLLLKPNLQFQISSLPFCTRNLCLFYCFVLWFSLFCIWGFERCVLASVGNVAASRRRQHAVTVGKERRESLVRAKRLCRVAIGSGDGEVPVDSDMITDEEQSILESQTSSAVQNLKSAIAYQ